MTVAIIMFRIRKQRLPANSYLASLQGGSWSRATEKLYCARREDYTRLATNFPLDCTRFIFKLSNVEFIRALHLRRRPATSRSRPVEMKFNVSPARGTYPWCLLFPNGAETFLIQFRYGFHLTQSVGSTAELGRLPMPPSGLVLRRIDLTIKKNMRWCPVRRRPYIMRVNKRGRHAWRLCVTEADTGSDRSPSGGCLPRSYIIRSRFSFINSAGRIALTVCSLAIMYFRLL